MGAGDILSGEGRADMFEFWKKNGKNKQLEALMQRIQMNVSNNYKDAAQLNLKEFEDEIRELLENGKLSDAQKAYYEGKLQDFKAQMKNFTHKDQKPFWT